MATNARPVTSRLVALLCALALGVLALGMPPRLVAADEQRIFRPGQLVVSLDPAAGLSIEALNAKLGSATSASLESAPPVYLLRLPPGTDPVLIAEQLELDPRLRYAEPNYISQAPEANPRGIGSWGGLDPAPLPGQPALAQVGLAEARALATGAGVTVAIIDTGVQLAHPALAGALALDGHDFVDGDTTPEDAPDGIDNDGDGLADEAYGHGTHVAGIVRQVAPGARILPLRALTAEGEGDAFAVAQAILYAASHGARVINLSLGTPATASVLKDAVRRASQAGALVVAAAGNEGLESKQYPAAANCVIGVTSVGATGAISVFANRGGWVSVAAPGEAILSAFPRDGYASWSGTSMATPFVSGQAALLFAARPELNLRQLTGLARSTAQELDDNGWSNERPGYAIRIGSSIEYAATGRYFSSRRSFIAPECVISLADSDQVGAESGLAEYP